MPDVTIHVPLEFGNLGLTASLLLRKDATYPPGLHLGPGMETMAFPEKPGEAAFLPTVRLAYQVALNHYDLSAGFSLLWTVRPCMGRLPGLAQGSAGAAFLLGFMKQRFDEFAPRPLRADGELEQAIAAVRLERIAASAQIDERGNFLSVDPDGLLLKMGALVREQPQSGVKLAVISAQQEQIGSMRVPDLDLFQVPLGALGSIPVLRAADAAQCMRSLFRLQSEQVLL